MTSPQIIEGGAKIIDSLGKQYWVKYIGEASARKIFGVLKQTKFHFSVLINSVETENYIPSNNWDKLSSALIYNLNETELNDLQNKLKDCSDLFFSINQDRTGNTVYITHRYGTKAHGIKQLMKLLKIKKEEIIGVGDGNNDYPRGMQLRS